MFSSRPPSSDRLDQRRRESWYGTRPVTLTKGDVTVRGYRQGRFGGVAVNAESITRMADLPNEVHGYYTDFRPPFRAELPDAEWAKLGWTINRPQSNPTNPILAAHRKYRESVAEMGLEPIGAHLSELPCISPDDFNEFGSLTPESVAHARKVLTRLANLTVEEA